MTIKYETIGLVNTSNPDMRWYYGCCQLCDDERIYIVHKNKFDKLAKCGKCDERFVELRENE
jgi:hypothetical protein